MSKWKLHKGKNICQYCGATVGQCRQLYRAKVMCCCASCEDDCIRAMKQRDKERGYGVNPHKPVEIYNDILEIRARKGKQSLFPKKFFKHKFTKRGAKIFGNPDGSLTIKGKQRLWNMFDYDERDLA